MLSSRAILVALALTTVALPAIQPGSTDAATMRSGAIRVERFAAAQLNKPFRWGADGPRRYDCSGLVFRTYYRTGLLRSISGRRRTANGYYRWFRRHHRITRHPRPGDLVVWTHRHRRKVSHIGIFVGYNRRGKPMAISALINPWGVTRHRVHGIGMRVKAYLRVRMPG